VCCRPCHLTHVARRSTQGGPIQTDYRSNVPLVKRHGALLRRSAGQERQFARGETISLVAAPTCSQARSRHLNSPEARSSSAETGGNLPIAVVLRSITHLQFLVLDLFRTTETFVPAQRLMSALQSLGIESEGPKFYQLCDITFQATRGSSSEQL